MAQENIDIVVKDTGAVQASANIKGVGDAAKTAGGQLDSFNSIVASVTAGLGALGLSFGIKSIIDASDAYGTIIDRLAGVSKSSKDLIAVEQQLFDVSQNSNRSFSDTAEMYSALRGATQKLGTDSSTLVNVVKNITEVLDKSDKTGKGSTASLSKLFETMENGTFRGQGLQAVFDQFPALLKAFSDNTGTSVKVLEQQASAGQSAAKGMQTHASALGQTNQVVGQSTITLQRFVAAFGKANEDFGNAPDKVSTAIEKLSAAFQRQIGIMDQARGTTALLVTVINYLAQNMQTIAPIVLAVVGGLTVFGVVAASTSGLIGALWAIVAAHPLALLAAAIVTVVQLFLAFGNQIKLTSDGTITAMGAVVGAFNYVVSAAQQLYTWVTTTSTGFYSFIAVVGIVTAALLILYNVAIVDFFLRMAAAIATAATSMVSFLISAAPVVAVLVGIAAAALAAYSVFKLVTTGAFNLGEEFDNLKAKVSGWKDDLVKSMQDATTSTSASGLAAKNWGDTFASSTNNAVTVLRGGAGDMNQSFNSINQGAAGTGSAIGGMANMVQNSMGQMVQATDDWAARSGAYFNQVTSQATAAASSLSATASSVQSSFKSISVNPFTGQTFGSVAPIGGGNGVFQARTNKLSKDEQNYLSSQGVDGGTVESLLEAQTGSGASDATASAFRQFARSQSSSAQAALKDLGFNFSTGGNFIVGGAGGTDSQLVQMMATPGERVIVQTAAQQTAANKTAGASPVSQGGPIYVSMTVVANDADSFRRTQSQLTNELASKLRRVQARSN